MTTDHHMDPAQRAHLQRLASLYMASMAVALAVLLVGALHATALANLSASRRLRSLDDRLAAAERSGFIEPWNTEFKVRIATLRAEQLLAEDRVDEALDELLPFAETTRDEDYSAAYASARRAAGSAGGVMPASPAETPTAP